jgi:hypothetical protein
VIPGDVIGLAHAANLVHGQEGVVEQHTGAVLRQFANVSERTHRQLDAGVGRQRAAG